MSDNKPFIGIIGGSGLYELEELINPKWIKVSSLFGEPSGEILIGELNKINIAFLPRHGKNHTISPSNINYRSNIDCLKKVGVTDIISFSAVGSLKENIKPGEFLLVDQFIDRTFSRKKTFFDNEIVAHVSMAQPVSKQLVDIIINAQKTIPLHPTGTYITMEGPQFSTLAESELYRSWNCDVICMTNMPEAKLAREAEMGYATVAMITDYDCWHPDHENVSVEQIIDILQKNSNNAKMLIKEISRSIKKTTWNWNDPRYFSLENAIITPESARTKESLDKIKYIASRVLKN